MQHDQVNPGFNLKLCFHLILKAESVCSENGPSQPFPCFCSKEAAKKYLITKRNRLTVEWFLIDGLDENGLLKTYALSIEDKMAAGAFGRARNYG